MSKMPKRPRDVNQLAKLITDIATGETQDAEKAAPKGESASAKARGGKARAKALTPQQRSEIASLAASARWKKS